MSQDQKFQQRWEFRRVDEDCDSSSNDSKSISGGKPLLKNHKLVPDSFFPENDETTNPLSQQENQLNHGMATPFEFGKADKMDNGASSKKYAAKNKVKRGSARKSYGKKNKLSLHQPISLDDFKIFTTSVIEELKVARENMFASMRDEMEKLVAVEVASRPKRKKGSRVQKVGRGNSGKNRKDVESAMKTKNGDGGSLERSMKSDRTTDSNNCYEALEKQVNHDQVGTIASKEKEKEKEKVEKLRSSAKKPSYPSNLCEQVVSSPYLTLPTDVSKPQAENRKLDSSCNYAAKNGIGLERAKVLIDASTRRGYFSGIQQAEQFGCFSQTGSQNLSCFDQQCTQTSNMGNGFPVPLHQGLENGHHIPSQAKENMSGEHKILGLKMSGGAIRFSGGSHALSEKFVSSSIRSNMNYKTDGGVVAFGYRDIKDSNPYQH
ncbi:uncharacterized protein LOC131316598 [Rhododendron vialii]|uniref:uncharacterized protein LOC131316598 n=1 Tax=Rhododendron vialii TaxID=182163 RepID=UPI00265F9ED9|nr:uncharacterized protein LOC131316598 [Rhododendron vialii]XP_058202002.1 uncharacterized protein LOC131316598 [Rhododendron vialii]XP_058202003.1 uncharacterized protein LOC131316598 [Rhododendron vialii]